MTGPHLAREQQRAQIEGRGYGDFSLLGPVDGREVTPEYTVTLFGPEGRALGATFRGTFLELREAIAALPKRTTR